MRRALIGIPVFVILFLLQSYFWVPTYEEQTKGSPERLAEYVTASIGDAQLLNPILAADSSSSTIDGLVFEGLIDYDENLNHRGRVAERWEISEVAYFYVNDDAVLPGLGRAGAGQVASLLRRAKSERAQGKGPLAKSLANIQEVEVIPAGLRQEKLTGKGVDGAKMKVTLNLSPPPRIKLTLKDVDQDLFTNLGQILGAEYFSRFQGERFIKVEPAEFAARAKEYARTFLPAVEHNPIILFHIRPGVQFHDGHPLEARDAQFTYQALMDPTNLSPRIADYEPVKMVEVLDPLTVRIVYKRLYSPALGTWMIGILPEHLLNRAALEKEARRRGLKADTMTIRQSLFNRHPVGCGPFRFEKWESDQYILLHRFRDYWEGPPNFHRYAYRIIPDLLTQEMEFYAGTVDSYDVQPYQVKRLKDDPRYQSFSGLSFAYTYIGYNMRRPPFDDVRVRRALGMAIDVDKIIRYVLYGQGERITGPFPKQTEFYDREVKPLPYDPAGAEKLLAEAGWRRNKDQWLEKDGKRLQFTLITNQGNDTRKAILSIAQDAWRKIGVDVRTDVLEWAVFIQQRVEKHDFDALVLGWSMGVDPDLYQIWHSSQTGPFQLNFCGYRNPEADDLIIRIRQEYDRKQQIVLCHELHRIIAADQPYTFLYTGKWTAILDKRMVIMERDSSGKVRYAKIRPTKTGNYTFFFNRWVRLPEVPVFRAEE
jgi:ABC-type transport system substrate-binding protein